MITFSFFHCKLRMVVMVWGKGGLKEMGGETDAFREVGGGGEGILFDL